MAQSEQEREGDLSPLSSPSPKELNRAPFFSATASGFQPWISPFLVSLSLAQFLSHYLSHVSLSLPGFLSLFSTQTDIARSKVPKHHRRARASYLRSEGAELVRESFVQHGVPSLVEVTTRGRAATGRRCSVVLQPLSPLFFGLNKFISTSSSKWYPLFMTKVPISLACISVQKRQILLVDPSQMEPYFEVTILNSYLWRKIHFNGIKYVYDWGCLHKVTFFETVCELTVRSVASFCV